MMSVCVSNRPAAKPSSAVFTRVAAGSSGTSTLPPPYVAVDYKGKEYSLSRWVGVKSKELKQRLGDPSSLPSVENAKKEIGIKMTDMLKKHEEKLYQHFLDKMQPIKRAVRTMQKQQKNARKKLLIRQKERF